LQTLILQRNRKRRNINCRSFSSIFGQNTEIFGCGKYDITYFSVLSGWIYSVEEKFCYQIVDAQPKSWQAAREYCQQNGGDLLSISGVTEQNFIEGQYNDYHDHILRFSILKLTSSSEFKWVNIYFLNVFL
jgi:hypothetical protein